MRMVCDDQRSARRSHVCDYDPAFVMDGNKMKGINKLLSKVYTQAKKDGRVCSRCGWIITKKDWAKGFLLCSGCQDAMQGVNVSDGWYQPLQEPVDKTGEML